MFWKIFLTISLLLVAWLVLFRNGVRPKRIKRKSPEKRGPQHQDLIKCSQCGIYLPADQTCRCRDHA